MEETLSTKLSFIKSISIILSFYSTWGRVNFGNLDFTLTLSLSSLFLTTSLNVMEMC